MWEIYRRKYDAAKALQGFSAQLRDETDLETEGGQVDARQPGMLSGAWRNVNSRTRQISSAETAPNCGTR